MKGYKGSNSYKATSVISYLCLYRPNINDRYIETNNNYLNTKKRGLFIAKPRSHLQ